MKHFSSQCRFRFKRKCACKQWHFSYLCTKKFRKSKESVSDNGASGSSDSKAESSSDSSKKIKDKGNVKSNETTSNSIVITDAFPSVQNGNSILPTFTCLLDGDFQVRILKDIGCQSNFITERVASSQNLKVIHENVTFKVKGFNADKQYSTKTVEIELKVRDKVYLINAICVSEIKVNLSLPKLPIITKSFIEKGYTLAYKHLVNSCSISNIDMILGTESAYCLKHSEVSFSSQANSIFAETELGVMLLGDIDTMIRDLPYLPCLVGTSRAWDSSVLMKQEIDLNNLVANVVINKSEYAECSQDFAVLEVDTLSVYVLEVSVNYSVLNDNGIVDEAELGKATADALEMESQFYTHYDDQKYEDQCSEINNRLVEFALSSTTQNSEGRLVMPVLWNPKVCHLLANNKELAVAILKSNLKRLKKNENNLQLMDASFREQERLGIIERIEDLDGFLRDHPEHSFLPHMGVFKLDRATTKCRVVYLSNLFQPNPSRDKTISHNMAMYSGPNMNQKLSSALLQLRFDKKLLVYDLSKAFNQISLEEVDANRLLCLWFRNVSRRDFSIIGFRNVRLPFGIRCAPTMLLLGLFKILVIDAQDDDAYLKDLKALLYHCLYMDNGGLTVNSHDELCQAYSQLDSIFKPYQFQLQQIATNDEVLQDQVDLRQGTKTSREIKLLGSLSTKPITLDVSANTKRTI